MPVFPSEQQAANQILVRVPVPAPVQSNKQQKPVQESQEAAEEQTPIKDENETGFERVYDNNPHSIIIPYYEEPSQKARQYETMRAPKDGLVNRGLFIGGGQFTPNTPDKQPVVNIQPAPPPQKQETTDLSKVIRNFKRLLKKHKK